MYRAHLNLNEMSSANQNEYEQMAYNQNVSSFQNEEEMKVGSIDLEQPLRITNKKEREGSAFSRGNEIEMQRPIMQMMQMHEQQFRLSNLSKNGPDSSGIFSDDSAMMMMVSDEGVFQQRSQSRGRTQHQQAQHPPVFKKNQSSPSKIFRQY